MNDIIFSNSFGFNVLKFNEHNYTDNRGGAISNYFAYMIKGRCKIVTESETVEIAEGDVFFIPDKCSYQSFWYGDPEIEFISLGFVYLPNFENKTYSVQLIDADAEAVELMKKIAAEKPLSANTVADFYTLTAMLMPKMSATRNCRTKELVGRATKYLNLNPYAKMAEVAKSCAVSEAALYAAFQKSSDITPNNLRNNILLDKAKNLLISTDKSVEEISGLIGFSSASYFRKKFKAFYGITPKEMRGRYRI